MKRSWWSWCICGIILICYKSSRISLQCFYYCLVVLSCCYVTCLFDRVSNIRIRHSAWGILANEANGPNSFSWCTAPETNQLTRRCENRTCLISWICVLACLIESTNTCNYLNPIDRKCIIWIWESTHILIGSGVEIDFSTQSSLQVCNIRSSYNCDWFIVWSVILAYYRLNTWWIT